MAENTGKADDDAEAGHQQFQNIATDRARRTRHGKHDGGDECGNDGAPQPNENRRQFSHRNARKRQRQAEDDHAGQRQQISA
jgi:hypothetical protein